MADKPIDLSKERQRRRPRQLVKRPEKEEASVQIDFFDKDISFDVSLLGEKTDNNAVVSVLSRVNVDQKKAPYVLIRMRRSQWLKLVQSGNLALGIKMTLELPTK